MMKDLKLEDFNLNNSSNSVQIFKKKVKAVIEKKESKRVGSNEEEEIDNKTNSIVVWVVVTLRIPFGREIQGEGSKEVTSNQVL